jgi:hypothetical protein
VVDLLRQADVAGLIRPGRGPHVSIFVPTERVEARTPQGRVRLKNLLRDAEHQLRGSGVRPPAVGSLLEPARRLAEAAEFWRYQSEGLALFLRPAWWASWRLPLEFEPLVVAGNRFYVKPLLPLLTGDGHFFVLALSQNEVRLLEGSRQRVEEVDLPQVPRGLREALRYDEPGKELLFHVTGRSGGATAVFHGHGAGGEEKKARILRYFRQIDHGLSEVLQEEGAPMVLAGVEYLLPIYREASAYPNLLDEGITGNPEHLDPTELHARAWSIVEPVFRRAAEEAAARYRKLAGTGQATGDLAEVVRAAGHGRVDTLFVAPGVRMWGRYEPDDGAVEIHDEREPTDEDLLDVAAGRTLAQGGTVFAVPPEEVPDSAPAAAILRY